MQQTRKKAMAFFGGNPFSSLVGQKIEQATDASLVSENWALNMEICDIINETEDGPKDAMRAIKKRLSQNAKNFTVIMYTLVVLETCVKNCGKRFHILACNKEFINELVKLIGPKNVPPTAVQDKVLNLVQSWADAFRNEPDLSGVVQVYNELKQKGMEFPMTDLDTMAPIHTPQRSFPEEVALSSSNNSTSTSASTNLTPDQLRKLNSELQVVEGNMTVLNEMLNELVPGRESPEDFQLLTELHSTCQAMQERLVELINQLSNDEITATLLRINDGLNNLFLRYVRYNKNRTSVKEGGKGDAKDAEEPLIELGDSSSELDEKLADLSLKSGTNQLSALTSIKAENNKDDEFDMFAQSRNVSYDSSKFGTTSYEANKECSNFSGSLAAAVAQPKGQNDMHSEREFDEMAAWLGEKHEESLTSSEFEKFLAERAAAAETLPPSTDNSTPSRTRTKKEENSMFAL